MTAVRCTVHDDGVAELVIDKPPVNALDGAEWLAFAELVRSFNVQDGVRVAVIRAEGRGFCAGVDIHELAGDSSRLPVVERGNYETFRAIWECRVPVIAAPHGFVLGGGIGIVGSADGIVAAEDAYFGLPEIDRGALGCGTYLVRMFGQQKARMLMYRAQRVSAHEAFQLGAIEQVVPTADLRDAALAHAREIAAKSPIAIRLAKESFNLIEYPDPNRLYRTEQGFTAELYLSPDSLEARRAFVEKRPATFD